MFGGAAILFSTSALAHGAIPHSLSDLWSSWTGDPLVTVPMLVTSSLFAMGALQIRHRLGRFPPGFGIRHIVSFYVGITLLAIALVSPLEGLSKPLLSAHMIQHILLIAVAPPLLVLGKPDVAWLWALPSGWGGGFVKSKTVRRVLAVLSPFTKPIPAAAVHMAVLWVWHSPMLFDAAVASDFIHWLEHLMFFGTALLFWRAVIRASSGRQAAAAALIACFVTLMQSGLLSALLSFAREALYDTPHTGSWGLTALEDQQLAGAIMSLPMCGIYLLTGLGMALRLLTPPWAERRTRPPVSPSNAFHRGP
jgi:putative membrane protein